MASLLLRKTRYVFQLQMARHLVTDPKYGFLKELGITGVNPGLYNGKWGGSGEVHDADFSLSITTGVYIVEVGEDCKSLHRIINLNHVTT